MNRHESSAVARDGKPYPSLSTMATRGKEIGVAISYSSEWEEFRVVRWAERLQPDKGYFTSDMFDAWDTALVMAEGQ